MKPKTTPNLDALVVDYQQTQSIRSRDAAVAETMNTVEYLAHRICARWNRGGVVDRDDLISAGVIGVMTAIDLFDPSRSVHFKTFAVPRIRGAMLDHLRENDWVPRLERQTQTAVETTLQKFGAACTWADVEGESPRVTQRGRPAMPAEFRVRNVMYLSRKCFESDRGERVLGSRLQDPQAAAGLKHMVEVEHFNRLLRGLDRSHQLMMRLYYVEDMTLKEIGATLDLSESRISQMHTQAIAGLRARLSPVAA